MLYCLKHVHLVQELKYWDAKKKMTYYDYHSSIDEHET